MNNKNVTEFLQDIFLGKFLLNFVPGLILFYVFNTFISVSTGEGLLSLLIVTSVSWTLGVLEEFIFFRKAFYRRWRDETFQGIDHIILLFGKIGIATLIACVFWIDLKWLLDLFDRNSEEDMVAINVTVKFILFVSGGVLLYWLYRKNSSRS